MRVIVHHTKFYNFEGLPADVTFTKASRTTRMRGSPKSLVESVATPSDAVASRFVGVRLYAESVGTPTDSVAILLGFIAIGPAPIMIASEAVAPARLSAPVTSTALAADVGSRATMEAPLGGSAAWAGELAARAGFATVIGTD